MPSEISRENVRAKVDIGKKNYAENMKKIVADPKRLPGFFFSLNFFFN